MEFSGQVVLVVGGSGGLGSAISRHMASLGAKVAILFHGRAKEAHDLISSIQARNGTAMAEQVDITSQASVEAALQSITASFGAPDVLINCAGISRNGMSWRLKEEDWNSTLEVNLTGVFRWVRAVLPAMRDKGRGRIVSISSIVGSVGIPGTAAYAASKAGIEGLTRATAIEAANKGITINALALGYFDAGIISDVPADKLGKIIASIPVGRLGRVEEVCRTIEFLCSEGASYMTGQTLHVNGGLFLS